ncbi:hypothetical protein PHAVU_003G195100 [Phaseolus vulgaris]|uniref:PPC domain-containing protein n=1 Tax=Phaseolus vulgaris TaxID=3885 RepID=V7CB43_PHAVU|nr:hypothetical protein PHAVU_003G195100g [Phaseolus vulgaris]ESW27359.1 hypothetical protein PHAVU_003G195100g [Phaseolus vulgaris]
MVQPSNVTTLSSTLISSSDDNTFDGVIDSSSHSKPPSSSSKRTRGRPAGSKNKQKLAIVIDQNHEHVQKPILIQIPINSDVIETLTQFVCDHQISIAVQSASGSILNATLRDDQSEISTFIVHGPFTLASFTGPCIYNNYSTTSLSSNLDYFLNISFCSNLDQSFVGVVGGKVIAGDDVVVTATTFKNS